MTSLSEENLNLLCDKLAEVGHYTTAAAAIGVTESCLYNWRARCIADKKKNDTSSPFYFQRRGDWLWFTEAVMAARQEFFLGYESLVRAQAKNGIEVPVRGPSQEILYKQAPQYIARDDDFVMLSEGCEPADVAWHRLLKDEKGHPIPETKIEQIPAQLRLRVLEAASSDMRPTSHQSLDVHHSGNVAVHQMPPLERPEAERVDLAELRALAAMSPEERRAKFGAKAHPMDAAGRRTIPKLSPPLHEQPDDQGHGLRPPAPEFARPQQPQPQPQPAPRPSYAKPIQQLDQASYGEGHVPDGGFKVA